MAHHLAWILGGLLAGILGSAAAMYRQWHRWSVEHEILIDDYCDRKHIEREDLPTRHR
jgi:hypothetical protein